MSITWGAFAVLVPAASLQTSRAWQAALSVIPYQSQDFLGVALIAAGFLASTAASSTARRAVVGLVGLAVSASLWAVLAGSFAYAAAETGGVGGGFAIVCGFVVWQHVTAAYARR